MPGAQQTTHNKMPLSGFSHLGVPNFKLIASPLSLLVEVLLLVPPLQVFFTCKHNIT